MNDRGIRHQLLRKSVQKLLDAETETADGRAFHEQVGDVVVLWTRHRWFVPYAALAGIVMFSVASVLGIEGTVNRLALGAGGIAVAAMATTNYWILARTSGGIVLCRSSRIRQYAKAFVSRLSPAAEMVMVGSTMVTSDWRIDGVEYTLTKRWEATMRAIASE